MAFSRDDIDRVRQATDLVELFGAITKVKRSGRSYMAVCPFHDEKSPSLSVDPTRGLYHCFGCGKSGDVFTFLEETQGWAFNEAVEELARRAGIPLEADPNADRRRGHRSTLQEAVRRAIDFYHRRLKSGDDAGPARAYLRSRGYDGDVVDEYKLGYAPEVWDTLVKELRAGGVPEKVMMEAGLVRRARGGRLYDYFRGRVMFPIHDLRGDPVGFGGRILAGEGAKYLNSPDSAIYNKSRLLYGLDRARSAISRSGRSVVVEGYTDVIALHRAGIHEAVATCGTALTDEHFRDLRRFGDRVVLAFDADAAGAGAARRVFELSEPVALNFDVRVAVMPDQADPADLVQAGRLDSVGAALDEAAPLVEFVLRHELAGFDLGSGVGRARALEHAVRTLSSIPDPATRLANADVVAKLVHIEQHVVEAALRSPAARGKIVESLHPAPDAASDHFELALLRLLLDGEPDSDQISPEVFRRDEYRAAAEYVLGYREGGNGVFDIHDPEIPNPLRSPLRAAAVIDDSFDTASVLERAKRMRIDAEIDRLEAVVASTDPSDEGYSLAFNRLIALQREKRQT